MKLTDYMESLFGDGACKLLETEPAFAGPLLDREPAAARSEPDKNEGDAG